MSELTQDSVQDNAQEVAPNDSQMESNESPDVNSFIAESKKYRSRAQEAESKLTALQSSIAKQEDDRLVEQNEWKELAEKRQTQISSMETDYNRLKGAEDAYREELLNGLSEEDRTAFGSLSVSQLRVLTDKFKITNDEPVAPTSSSPARSVNPTNKNWVDMSSEERRSNWGDILNSYIKK